MNKGYDEINLISFSGNIEGGTRWDSLTQKRMSDPKSLEPYGYKVYSQNDEDGIINEIFNRIGTTDKRFIEFGVQNGLESNTHLLLFYGWNGLWIEGASEYCDEINIRFRPVIEAGKLRVQNAFITRDNINELFEQNGFTGEIDLLSVDIDGNDLYVWEAIDVVDPRVVIVEYNGKFPPDLEWSQAYNDMHVWSGTDWHGASLKALEKLGIEKGYRLVGTNLRGCNAFFVREDLMMDMFHEPCTAEELYNPLRLNLTFSSNHSSEYCLAIQKEGYGLLNYRDYELVTGFYDEEIRDGKTHAWTSGYNSELRVLGKTETKKITIPWSLPKPVFKAGASITVRCDDADYMKEYVLNNLNGEIEVSFEKPLEKESIIKIHISSQLLWSPRELMRLADDRMLGIDICLSDIKLS